MNSHRFVIKLLAVVFAFCVLGVAVLTATNLVFGTRSTLKESLEEGQIYDTVATEIVEAATKHTEQSSPQEIPLDNVAVKDVAKKVITGEKIQGYAEQIVDGTYNWLEGQTETPDFTVDLTPIKQELGNSVAEAGVQQVQGLPTCTPEQLQQINVNSLDLFSLQCLPPGINLEVEQQKLIAKTMGSQEILKDTNFNANDTATESGEKPFEKVSYLPTIFQWSKILPWILSVLGLAAGTGIVSLHADRRQGLKKISKTLLVTGVALLAIAGMVSFLFSKIRPNPEVVEVIELRDSMLIVITSLGSALNRVLIIFASIYAVVGGGGLVGLHFLKSRTALSGVAPTKQGPRGTTPNSKSKK